MKHEQTLLKCTLNSSSSHSISLLQLQKSEKLRKSRADIVSWWIFKKRRNLTFDVEWKSIPYKEKGDKRNVFFLSWRRAASHNSCLDGQVEQLQLSRHNITSPATFFKTLFFSFFQLSRCIVWSHFQALPLRYNESQWMNYGRNVLRAWVIIRVLMLESKIFWCRLIVTIRVTSLLRGFLKRRRMYIIR